MISCTSKTDTFYEKNMENNLLYSVSNLKDAIELISNNYNENPVRTKRTKLKCDTIYSNYVYFDSVCENYLKGKLSLSRDSLLNLYFMYERKLITKIPKDENLLQSSLFKLDSSFKDIIKNERLFTLLMRNNLAINTTYLIKYFLYNLNYASDRYISYDSIYIIKEVDTKSNCYKYSLCSKPLSIFPKNHRMIIDSIICDNKLYCGEILPLIEDNYKLQNSIIFDERLYTMRMNSLNQGNYTVFGKLLIDYDKPLNIQIKPFNYKFKIDKNKTSH